MKIILFVLLLVSAQIEVYAQQKQSKKSWGSRAMPVEVIEAKKTKLYSLIPSYGRIISLQPYSIISKVNEEVKKIYVLEGTDVVKGQKLIELESLKSNDSIKLTLSGCIIEKIKNLIKICPEKPKKT